MPIYEFECLECKSFFEIIVSSADAARNVACRKCASTKVRKIISAGSSRVTKGASPPAAGCSAGSRFK